MRTNTIKRTLAGVFAAAMLCSAASCSSGGNNGSGDGSNGNGSGNSPSASNVSDKTITNVYRSVEMNTDLPMEYISAMTPLGDSGNFIVCGSDTKGNSYIYIADPEFSSFTELDLGVEYPENSTHNMNCCVLGKRGLCD